MTFQLGMLDGLSGRSLGSLGHVPSGVSDPHIFNASLQASLIPERAGNGTPTFTRATVAYVADWENLLKPVLSGEARFTGARRVYNLLPGTQDYASWIFQFGASSVSTTATAPDGSATALQAALTIAGGAGVGSRVRCSNNNGSSVGSVVPSVWIKADAASTVRIQDALGGSATEINVTTSWQRYALSAWTISGAFTLSVYRPTGSTVTNIYLWHPQAENVTGQSNQNPSEYVSVGVLSAPYHGAGVDGVKYFTTLNGNTVASNVVTEATGAAIVTGAAGVSASTVDAGGPFGYFAEGAGTQLVTPTASIRDMTNAAWTAGATMTVAKTSTGIDGVASACTRLTAGAVAATNIITQTLVAAASSRTYSCRIKRITGTGPVRLTQDNFATDSDISGSLIANTWVRVSLTQSQLNAVFGIKIDTLADAIDVDFNQFEAGAFATSPMAAAGAARNADVLTYVQAANILAAAGSLYCEYTAPNASYIGRLLGIDATNVLFQATSNVFGTVNGGTITVQDGTNTATVNYTPADQINKAAASYGGTSMKAFINGSAGAAGTFDGNILGATNFAVGNRVSGALALFGTIRNVRIYSTALTDAQLQAMTT